MTVLSATNRSLVLGLGLLFGATGAVLARPPEVRPGHGAHSQLGAAVVHFARTHLNKEVGNGECWTLAFGALQAANAHLPGRDGYGVYVFGRPVSLDRLQPGDVLQFEKVRFDEANGSWQEFSHHTAIVESARGKEVTLLNQNVDGMRKVVRTKIDLAERSRGTIVAYRPQPR